MGIKKYQHTILWVGNFMAAFIIYNQCFKFNYVYPHVAEFYDYNSTINSFKDLLSTYISKDGPGIWYRPTSFFVYWTLITAPFGWHAIWFFKFVSVTLAAILAVLVGYIGRRAFKLSSFQISILCLFTLGTPLQYRFTHESWGFEYLYLIFGFASLLFMIIGLEKNSTKELSISALLFVVAITCKEQAITFLGINLIFLARNSILGLTNTKKAIYYTVFITFISAAYMILHFGTLNSLDGRHYRTNYVSEHVFRSLEQGYYALFLKFNDIYHPQLREIYGTMSSLLSYAIIGLVTACAIALLTKRPRYTLDAATLGSCLIGSIVIPAFSGGGSFWHYFMPQLFLFILISMVLDNRLITSKMLKTPLVLLLTNLILLITFSWLNSSWANGKVNKPLWEMNSFLINNKVLDDPPPNSVVMYSRGRKSQWSHGTGRLVKYGLLRTDIDEWQLHSKLKPSDLANISLKWLISNNAYYLCVSLKASPPISDCTESFREIALENIKRHISKTQIPDELKKYKIGLTNVKTYKEPDNFQNNLAELKKLLTKRNSEFL